MASITAPTLASETIAHIGTFPVRNTMVMAWMTMIILILFAILVSMRRYRLVPSRLQTATEMVVGGLFDFFDSILQDKALTRKIFPIMATFFLFILTGNWLGILPGVNSITVKVAEEGHTLIIPVLRSMNADVNMTLAFTLVSVIMTQVLGIATLGILPHLGKYFTAPWRPINFFVGILEFVGEFARLISFVFRLFGNIFAGEVLLIVISFLAPHIVPIPFLGLEIFVGFIQALVFCLLTLAFVKMAVSHHGDHGDSHAHNSHSSTVPA